MKALWRNGQKNVLDRKERKTEAAHYEKLKVRPSGLDYCTVTEIISAPTLGLAMFW